MIELTGNSNKIDAFIDLLGGYEILELARTGIVGLGRGTDNITYLDSFDTLGMTLLIIFYNFGGNNYGKHLLPGRL